MSTETSKCIVCGHDSESDLKFYCYKHYQMLKSLANEFAAVISSHFDINTDEVRHTRKDQTWKDFLMQKNKQNKDLELEQFIKAELAQ
jgi:hypothetical protein